MTKEQAIESPSVVSWREVVEPDAAGGALALQIMNVMEQGIIVWSAEGICELHNTRIFEILEIPRDVLSIGTDREDFLEFGLARGEFDAEMLAQNCERFSSRRPFQFDRVMPSGRVVTTYARPMREGGYVVTFTDVSEARKAALELADAKQIAEDAEARAREVLQEERAR